MATPRALVDDHPLLTARHVDALTDAVRALTRVVSKANELIQQQIRILAERTTPTPPMPTAYKPGGEKTPTIQRPPFEATIASSRASVPQRRRRPR